MPARSVLAAAAAAIAATALAPNASAHPRGGDADGLLPALPAHAPPGVCYARVRAEARLSPPTPDRAHWRLSPPPPGAPGPVWCLIVEPGAPGVVIAPERYGWIRVLCDGDATPVRIAGVQRRLHARGLYAGEASGRYDEATAAAVSRFQSERHIAHGGYLSLRTLEALEEGGFAASGYGPLPPPAYIPPPPPPVAIFAGPQLFPANAAPDGWLTWPGKTRY